MSSTETVFQLVYLSFAKVGFDKNHLSALLEKSRINNVEINVTGMLLYKGGVFLQLLEGPEANVRKLYDKISKDERHENIKSLIESDGNERLFGGWTMAYKEINDIDLETINTILPWAELANISGKKVSNDKIMNILKSFRYLLK